MSASENKKHSLTTGKQNASRYLKKEIRRKYGKLARKNQQKAGLENVELLKGEIEDIPLPNDSVDVIISKCVITLSSNKDLVFKEAFRVLKPRGRLAVSDVVVRGQHACGDPSQR